MCVCVCVCVRPVVPEEPGEWVEGPGERLISPRFSGRWGRA